MSRFVKAVVALVGALATWGVTAAEDSTYTQVELWGALLALATAAGVYAAPNDAPPGERGAADLAYPAIVVALTLVAVYLLLRYL